jgi:hypothetical protein
MDDLLAVGEQAGGKAEQTWCQVGTAFQLREWGESKLPPSPVTLMVST